MKVVTCGKQEPVISVFGVPVKAKVLLKDVNADDFDALVVPS